MQEQKMDRGDITIDLKQVFMALCKRAWIIVAATVLLGVAGYVYSAAMIQPVYRSSFVVYMDYESDGTAPVDVAEHMAVAYVYQQIATGNRVLTEAAKKCGFDSVAQMQASVSAEVSTKAAIITVNVDSADPAKAANLAQAIALVSPAHVSAAVSRGTMQLLEEPQYPGGKYSPSNGRNAILGALVGLLLSAGTVAVLAVIQDQKKTLQGASGEQKNN